jgi:hypothetical protein
MLSVLMWSGSKIIPDLTFFFSFRIKGNFQGVNWGMRKLSKILLGVLTVAAIASVAGYAYASYVMTTQTITVTVTDPQTMSLGASSQTIVSGQSLTLTATISDQRNGVVVTFYDGETSVGQATSAGGGIASLTIQPSMGTHNYHATGLHP